MPNNDKKGIILLLIITILISLIGTFSVINSVNKVTSSQNPVTESKDAHSSSSQGEITLTVEQPAMSQTTGKIILNVEKR